MTPTSVVPYMLHSLAPNVASAKARVSLSTGSPVKLIFSSATNGRAAQFFIIR